MRFLSVFLLTLAVFLLDFAKSTRGFTEANAVAPAIAAPAIAIGALELAALTAATAASIGIITVQKNESLQKDIAASVDKLKNATAEMIALAVSDANVLLKVVSGVAEVCSDAIYPANRKTGGPCTASPEACCGDYFSKFNDRIDRGRGGTRVFKNSHTSKLSCCLEWDHQHGGFEIFDERGNHLGERGCDDLSEDPCTYTKSRGKHAFPARSTHRPRSSACSR